MKTQARYRAIIIILAAAVIIEGIVIFSLVIFRPKKRIIKLKPPVVRTEKGKIAIVIDDWGYNLNNLVLLKQIKYPLTLAILPNLAYSKRISQEAHVLGFETILHLPMEPREKVRLEQNTVMTGMDSLAVKDILVSDLGSIDYVKGVSNHMGSAAIGDPAVINVIFSELKKRRMYFLDSYVSSQDITRNLAIKMNLGFARRNVFLDNKDEPQYIKEQIFQLKIKAKNYGRAIGIGHDRKSTLEVLKEVMPQLEKEGYKFVFVSELLRQ